MKCKELEAYGFVQTNDRETQFQNIADKGECVFDSGDKLVVSYRSENTYSGRLNYGDENNELISSVSFTTLENLMDYMEA